MSNIIQFLESMGKDAALANMSPEEFTTTVKALGVDDVAEHALLNRDHDALNDLLGGRMKMMMMLVPAEDDDQGEKKPDEDEDKEQKDSSQAN
ncbi:MAG TPA: hypothetical protein PLS60_05905 [Arenimonas sp.]|nr:hypothetical protein [Arenimonas sp.]